MVRWFVCQTKKKSHRFPLRYIHIHVPCRSVIHLFADFLAVTEKRMNGGKNVFN